MRKPAAPKSRLLRASKLSELKMEIQQIVPGGSTPQKGPYSIDRSFDANEFVLPRRVCEGVKLISSRVEFNIDKSKNVTFSPTSSSESEPESSESSSPEVHHDRRASSRERRYHRSHHRHNRYRYSRSRSRERRSHRRVDEGVKLISSRVEFNTDKSKSVTFGPTSSSESESESSESSSAEVHHYRRASSRERGHHRSHHRHTRYRCSRSRSRERRSHRYEFPAAYMEQIFIPHPVPCLPTMWGYFMPAQEYM